jgi:hypothetical protein
MLTSSLATTAWVEEDEKTTPEDVQLTEITADPFTLTLTSV